MRRFLALAAGSTIALSLASEAAAGIDASMRTLRLVADDAPTRTVSGRFTLVGLHWRGPGKVVFRTRSFEGHWSAWRPAAPEDEDGPDELSREGRRAAAWRVGNPWWVGPSDRVETRAIGRVHAVRAHLVWSPEIRVPLRTLAAAEAPAIVPRLSWGANEAIRRAPPSFAPTVRFAVVHHTAGRNDYSRSEAAAIVKGIQLYHVQGNGWNDIGYNFLVDRFGTVYEGRHGGVDKNVVGAHAKGFNTGSVGVAVLGTYGGTAPSQAAQDAVARLLAWRLDLAHVDPLGILNVISSGNERYPTGIPVLLRAVSGHRDTGFTECPGDAFYARLNTLASAIRGTGLPKIFEPRVEIAERTLRFRARLSSPIAWSVSVGDAAGAEVARGAGTGADVDWTWDAVSAAPGAYTWSIRAGAARPGTGSLRLGTTAVPLAIEEIQTTARVISPNGDGQADTATVTYRLTAPANVTVEITDAVGAVVATLVDRVWTAAGRQAVAVDGSALADGTYNVVVTARTAAGVAVQKVVPLAVTRTLGVVTAAPSLFSPNGDGRRDNLVVTFTLAAPAEVRVRIVREGRWVASPVAATFEAGTQRFVWSGARGAGMIKDGSYEAIVEVTDGVGTISVTVPFASDRTPPKVRILPERPLRVEVSEPAVLTMLIDGQPVRREVKRAGIVRIRWSGPARRVRVVAWDAAGNTSGPVLRVARAR